jgi:hypothetical protein
MRYRISELRAVIRKILVEAVGQNKAAPSRDIKAARTKSSRTSKKEIEKEEASSYEDKTSDEDDNLLVEPDLSAEDDRDIEEYSSLAGLSIRGHMSSNTPPSKNKKD